MLLSPDEALVIEQALSEFIAVQDNPDVVALAMQFDEDFRETAPELSPDEITFALLCLRTYRGTLDDVLSGSRFGSVGRNALVDERRAVNALVRKLRDL